ncbi:MAG: DUF4276 family protein [Micromonosporaceae bacterium]
MSNRPVVASIVEGHGEVQALPLLIRRIAGELFHIFDVEVPTPHRVPRSQMLAGEALIPAVRIQGARIHGRGGVLILTDADDDCAVEVAGKLADNAKQASRCHCEVTVAVREFEAWFLASAESLQHHRSFRHDARYLGDPERPRDAKGALQNLMHEPYRENLHQPSFASLMDLALAQRSRSFAHLVRCVDRLLAHNMEQP